MKHLFLPLLIFLLVSCTEERSTTDQLERISYSSSLDGADRSYFVWLPSSYDERDEWPVLFFLHGNGERGDGKDELDYVLKHGPLYEAWIQKRDLPFIIVAPQLHMLGMDSIATYIANRTPDEIPKRLKENTPARPERFPTPYKMTGSPMDPTLPYPKEGLPVGWPLVEDDLNMMLDTVLSKYATNPSQVYLTGLSYGGFGTWHWASQNPERFAAIAPVVGYAHPDLMENIATHQIPVWAFAGGRDNVVPVKYFYSSINKLDTISEADVRFTVHEDMGHDTWVRVYAGDDLYNWFLEHARQQQ